MSPSEIAVFQYWETQVCFSAPVYFGHERCFPTIRGGLWFIVTSLVVLWYAFHPSQNSVECSSRCANTEENDVGEHDIEQELARVEWGSLNLLIVGAAEKKPSKANSQKSIESLLQLFQRKTINPTSAICLTPSRMGKSLQTVELCARSQWKSCVWCSFRHMFSYCLSL